MIIYQKMIHRIDLQSNPDVLYVFGDNDDRAGYGGQAKEMRGEPNAVGIRVKRHPGRGSGDFYSDTSVDYNCRKIQHDFQRIRNHLYGDGIVVFPRDGVGTGLSELDRRAPETFAYLVAYIEALKK